MTQMNQHQALANLHKVVQICNSGINLSQVKSQPIQNLNLNNNSSTFVAQNQYAVQFEKQKVNDQKLPILPLNNLNVSSYKQIEADQKTNDNTPVEGIKPVVTPNGMNTTSVMITAVPDDGN